MTERMRFSIEAAEIKFFLWMEGLMFGDRMGS